MATRASERSFVVVGTKADKLSGNTLRKAISTLTQDRPELRVVPYSARTGLGRDELWQQIRAAIAFYSAPNEIAL